MPHIILVLSGLADDPQSALDGRTPLAAADTPSLDLLAARSEVGLVRPCPEAPLDDPAIGADWATLALLGYDAPPPARGAVELLGAGASLGWRDVGLRLDLLSLSHGLDPFVAPPSAAQAERLWADLAAVWQRPGLSARGVAPATGLALWESGPVEVQCTPPGALDAAQPLEAQLPVGERDGELRRLIDDARELLADHAVNRERDAAGLPRLDVLWPWGCGRAPELPLFMLRVGQVASLFSSNPAVRGVARAAGVSIGRQDAAGPAQPHERWSRLLSALDHAPTVLAQVRDLDTAGHTGDAERKRDALAQLERDLFAPLMAQLARDRSLAVTILGDYACRLSTRRHANRPAPYLAWRPGRSDSGPGRFTEDTAAETGRERHGAADLRGLLWSLD